MAIFVNRLHGERLVIDTANVKRDIEDCTGLDETQYTLYHEGRPVVTFEDGMSVLLRMRLSGGGASASVIDSTVNNSTAIQEAMSTISQQQKSTCSFVCESSIENVNITLIDSDIKGGITIRAVCQANASCSISHASGAQVTTDLDFSGLQSGPYAPPAGTLTWYGT